MALACLPAMGQSNQEWMGIKSKCGLSSGLAYNDWVASGSPCNTGTPAAPAAAAPATLNPALANAAQNVGYALGQQLGKALFGDPAAKAAEAAAAQQRALAAQRGALAAKQLNDSGVFLFKAGNYTGAINEFQQALVIAPNDANILHNLATAKQKLKDTAVAAKNSGALANVLGDTAGGAGKSDHDLLLPASAANSNASALSLVNLDPNVVDFRGVGRQVDPSAPVPNSDPNVVNLSGTTNSSPASLKSQIDAVFGNSAPASATPAVAVNPIDREQQTSAQVDAIFEKSAPDPDAAMKAIFDLNDKSK
jgi:tetratricopeptide (TPR) repeat protein